LLFELVEFTAAYLQRLLHAGGFRGGCAEVKEAETKGPDI